MSAYQRWGLAIMLFALLCRTGDAHVNGLITAFIFGAGATMLTSPDRNRR